MNTLLKIENLHASVGEKEILRGINLEAPTARAKAPSRPCWPDATPSP